MKNIVLILGAGASKPYGFPLGGELISEVKKHLNNADNWRAIADGLPVERRMTSDQKKVIELFDQGNGITSIDDFINKSSYYAPLLREAIKHYLLKVERNNSIERDSKIGDPADNWYRELFRQLFSSEQTPTAQFNLTILTFNYDRSLEAYLINALEKQYTSIHNSEDAAKLLNDWVKIYHINGSLGLLISSRMYGSDTGSKIKFIGEHQDNKKVMSSYSESLEQADKIIFLGNAYHASNMQLLGNLESIGKGCIVLGTSVGLGGAQFEQISSTWPIELDSIRDKNLEFLMNKVGQFSF